MSETEQGLPWTLTLDSHPHRRSLANKGAVCPYRSQLGMDTRG